MLTETSSLGPDSLKNPGRNGDDTEVVTLSSVSWTSPKQLLVLHNQKLDKPHESGQRARVPETSRKQWVVLTKQTKS